MIQRALLSVLFVLAVCSAGAQNIDSLFELQRRTDPHEKIHVHFDKNYYNPGETIWFKAYVFNGINLSDSSRNFYAELVDEDGKLLSRVTAPISFAGASGSFLLDSAFARSSVLFRAYTVAMLNSDTAYLYTKSIRVLAKGRAAAGKPGTAATTLAFLPEGGEWVAGIPATMAFIATDARGLPVSVSGIISDNSGAKVADFRSVHNGMGSLMLLAEAGKTYKATWKDERGKTYSTALPAPKAQGLSLRVVQEAQGKRFLLNRSANAPQRLHVLATMNQEPLYKADIDMSARVSAGGLFPTAQLPSGMLCITVFDSSYRPLLERVVFVNNHEYEFDGDVYMTQKNAGKRTLNKLEISMSDTMPANVSLSVTDADLNESNTMDDNIVSRVLLTSELRGRIVNPYYYFYSNNDSVAYQLDLLLLTHGWRRYDWDAVMAGKTKTQRWRESNYIDISGKIQGLPPGRLSANLFLNGILQMADSSRQVLSLPVDRKGNVFADGNVFYDTAHLYFSFSDKNIPAGTGVLQLENSLVKGPRRIVPDSNWLRLLTDPSPATLAANSNALTLARQYGSGLRGKELEVIRVQGRSRTSKEKMEEKYVGPLFSGSGMGFDLVNDPLAANSLSVFSYLQGKVAGLQLSGSSNNTLTWRGGTPGIYLNDMQTEAEQVAAIPVADIAYIKVIRPGESVAQGGGNGVIAIYTKKGGDAPVNSSAHGLSYALVEGYTTPRVFYSPDYATDAAAVPGDFRSTLYWAPVLYLDRSRRKLRLQFYNNDITRNFRLVLEGVNSEGKLIHVEKRIAADQK